MRTFLIRVVPSQCSQHCTSNWPIAGANVIPHTLSGSGYQGQQQAASKITTVVRGILKQGQTAIINFSVSHHQIIRPLHLAKESSELWS